LIESVQVKPRFKRRKGNGRIEYTSIDDPILHMSLQMAISDLKWLSLCLRKVILYFHEPYRAW